MKTCNVAACGERATRYGRLCHTHRSRKRRHGDPAQRPVTKAALAPYIAIVRHRINLNADNLTWPGCSERWRAVVKHASSVLAGAGRGMPALRAERDAAGEIIRLSENVAPMAIMETALAMFVMADRSPSRAFPTDQGFDAQLVRRIRGLTDMNAGFWFDHMTGKTKRAYREVTPRTSALLATWFKQAFGTVGIRLAALERRDWEEKQAHAAKFAAALGALQ